MPLGSANDCSYGSKPLDNKEGRNRGFGPDLEAGFDGKIFNEDDLLDGAIIISPTKKNYGHVGLLGERQGDDRLIYSNSSAHGLWERDWSVNRWYPRYRDRLGLEVLFYPIPKL